MTLILSASSLLAGSLLTLAVVAGVARSTRPAAPVVVGGPRSHRRRAARVPVVAELADVPLSEQQRTPVVVDPPTRPSEPPSSPPPGERGTARPALPSPSVAVTTTGEYRLVADAVIAARNTARKLSIR